MAFLNVLQLLLQRTSVHWKVLSGIMEYRGRRELTDEEKVADSDALPSPIQQFEAGYTDRWSRQLLTWGVEARGSFSVLCVLGYQPN
jgi:hypothetical protein